MPSAQYKLAKIGSCKSVVAATRKNIYLPTILKKVWNSHLKESLGYLHQVKRCVLCIKFFFFLNNIRNTSNDHSLNHYATKVPLRAYSYYTCEYDVLVHSMAYVVIRWIPITKQFHTYIFGVDPFKIEEKLWLSSKLHELGLHDPLRREISRPSPSLITLESFVLFYQDQVLHNFSETPTCTSTN